MSTAETKMIYGTSLSLTDTAHITLIMMQIVLQWPSIPEHAKKNMSENLEHLVGHEYPGEGATSLSVAGLIYDF